jgi:hypothetical protein
MYPARLSKAISGGFKVLWMDACRAVHLRELLMNRQTQTEKLSERGTCRIQNQSLSGYN